MKRVLSLVLSLALVLSLGTMMAFAAAPVEVPIWVEPVTVTGQVGQPIEPQIITLRHPDGSPLTFMIMEAGTDITNLGGLANLPAGLKTIVAEDTAPGSLFIKLRIEGTPSQAIAEAIRPSLYSTERYVVVDHTTDAWWAITEGEADGDNVNSSPNFDFWYAQSSKILDAKEGETLKIDARGVDAKMPALTADLLRGRDVTLEITYPGESYNKTNTFTLNGKDIPAREANRYYYDYTQLGAPSTAE